MKITNCRVHKGKFVRKFAIDEIMEKAIDFESDVQNDFPKVIKCITPDCVHNIEDECDLDNISIEENVCMNYEQRKEISDIEASYKKAAEIEIDESALENMDTEDEDNEENEDDEKDIEEIEKDLSKIRETIWEDPFRKQ